MAGLTPTFRKFAGRRRHAFAQVHGHLWIGRVLHVRGRSDKNGTFRAHGANYAIEERRSPDFERLSSPIPKLRKISPTQRVNTRGIVRGRPGTVFHPQRESAGFFWGGGPDFISKLVPQYGWAACNMESLG